MGENRAVNASLFWNEAAALIGEAVSDTVFNTRS